MCFGGGLFTGALGEHFDSNDDFQRALSGRVSKGFQLTGTVGMHLGLGASSRHGQFDAVTVKPEDHWVDRLTVVELDAQSSRVANVEAAFTIAGLSVQREWFDGVYEGESGGRAQSHYLQASYFLGGQGRVYRPDFGVFGPVSVNKNDWMALEFFARHSVLSASNDQDDKNRLSSNSVGVNWFPGNRVRLSLEYGVVRSDEQISTVDDGERLNGRIQFLY